MKNIEVEKKIEEFLNSLEYEFALTSFPKISHMAEMLALGNCPLVIVYMNGVHSANIVVEDNAFRWETSSGHLMFLETRNGHVTVTMEEMDRNSHFQDIIEEIANEGRISVFFRKYSEMFEEIDGVYADISKLYGTTILENKLRK